MEADYLVQHYEWLRERVRYKFPGASADDVVQETYYEVLKYLRGNQRQVDKPAGLLWAVAKRVAIRLKGRGPRRRQVFDSCRVDELAYEQQVEASVSERKDELHRALARLPSRDNHLLLQRYFEGRSVRELMAEQDCSKGTVCSRLYKARRDLRKILGRRRA